MKIRFDTTLERDIDLLIMEEFVSNEDFVAAYSAQQISQRAHEDPALKDRCAEFVALFAATMGDTDCSVVKPQYFKDGQRCLAVVEKAAELMLAYMKK